MADARPSILCIGEVLWDVFPHGRFLGGAPLNVTYHLRALGRDATIASRVGDDELGLETRQRMAELGLGDRLVQTDPARPTGRVNVTLIDAHTPAYDIEQPAAWDAIELTDDLRRATQAAAVFVFGSLAWRNLETRSTVRTLLRDTNALRVFDVNLREPFVDRVEIEYGLKHADLLKVNDEELQRLRGWLGLPAGDAAAAEALCERFECQAVCLTRGAGGAALWLDRRWVNRNRLWPTNEPVEQTRRGQGEWHEHPGYRVTAVDPVGAGDAFLAALIDRLLAGDGGAAALAAAGALGAFVASRPSACPPHDAAVIAAIRGM